MLDSGGRISGQIVDRFGDPLAGLWVEPISRDPFEEGSRSLWAATHTTEVDGIFDFAGVPDNVFTLMVHPQPFAPAVLYRATDLLPNTTEIEIVLAEDKLPNAYLSGQIVSGAEGRVAEVRAVRRVPGARATKGTTDADGFFRLGPLVAGEYSVSAQPKAGFDQRVARTQLAANQELDLGALELIAPIPITVAVAEHVGFGPYDKLNFLPQQAPDGTPPLSYEALAFDAAQADSVALLPGSYHVRATGPETAIVNATLNVTVQDNLLALAPRPGVRVVLTHHTSSGLAPGFMRTEVRNARDELVQVWVSVTEKAIGSIGSVRLEPGEYTITLQIGQERRDTRRLTIEASDPEYAIELQVD